MLSALAKTRCRDKAEQVFEIMAETKRKLPFGELAAAVRRLAAGGLIEEAGGVYELCGALKTASRGKYYKGAAWKGEFFAAAEETARRFAAEELPDGAAEGAPAFTAEEYADGAKLYQRYILRPLQKSAACAAASGLFCAVLLAGAIACAAEGLFGDAFMGIVAPCVFSICLYYAETYKALKRGKEPRPAAEIFSRRRIAFAYAAIALPTAAFYVYCCFHFWAAVFAVAIVLAPALALLAAQIWGDAAKIDPKKTYRAGLPVAKAYSPAYYIDGVNVFDDARREKFPAKVLIFVGKGEETVGEAYLVRGETMRFLVAVRAFEGCFLLYLLRRRDVWRLSEKVDWHRNDVELYRALEKIVAAEEKDLSQFCYSADGMARGYVSLCGGRYRARVEVPFFGDAFDAETDTPEDFDRVLDYEESGETRYAWSPLAKEDFQTEEEARRYIRLVLEEFSAASFAENGGVGALLYGIESEQEP